MAALAILSIVAGLLMLATGARRRFPCIMGGFAAVLGGGFFVCLPYLDSIGAFGWLWFCAWLATLPTMIGCFVALAVIVRHDQGVLLATVLCGVAITVSIPPTVAYWEAAGLGVV